MLGFRLSLVVICMLCSICCIFPYTLQAQEQILSPSVASPPLFDIRKSTLIRDPKTKVGDLGFTLKANKTKLEMWDEITFEYAIHNHGTESASVTMSHVGSVMLDEITFAVCIFDGKGRYVQNVTGTIAVGRRLPLGFSDVDTIPPGEEWKSTFDFKFGGDVYHAMSYSESGFPFEEGGKYYLQFIALDRAVAPVPSSQKTSPVETKKMRSERVAREWRQFLIDNPGRVVAASEPWELNVTLPKAVVKKP